jgi:hypothetical protein
MAGSRLILSVACRVEVADAASEGLAATRPAGYFQENLERRASREGGE